MPSPRSLVLAGLTLTLLAAGVYLVTRSSDFGVPTSEDRASLTDAAPTAEAAQRSSSATRAGAPGDTAARRTELTETGAASIVLQGRVLIQEDRTPVAGVVVKVNAFDAAAAFGPSGGQAVTDAQGQYEITATRSVEMYSVRVGPGPATSSVAQNLPQLLRPGERKHLDLLVSRGATLSGRVEDSSGKPVQKAIVHGWCASVSDVNRAYGADPDRVVEADEEGRFTVTNLGEEFTLSAEAAGLTCIQRLHGTLRPGLEGEGLKLVMTPALRLRGRVLSPEREPVPGVEVHSFFGYESSARDATDVPGVWKARPVFVRATTSSDGSFELVPLAKADYHLELEAPGYPVWSERISAESG